MDGQRFDQLTRALADARQTSPAGTSRRRLLAGMLAAAVGAVGPRTVGRAACPPEQVQSARGCVCKTTGRPPEPATGYCPCPNGTTRCDGVCVDTGRDTAHCGGCGRSCPGPAPGTCDGKPVCREGVCAFRPAAAGTVCRPPAHPCDAPETCDGRSHSCPPDAALPDGARCDAQGDACIGGDACRGGVCVPGLAVQAACTETGACCQGEPTVCGHLALVCAPDRGQRCCHPIGGSCSGDCDCCGDPSGTLARCFDGECCHLEGFTCSSSAQCCTGFFCEFPATGTFGTCQPSVCRQPQEPCIPSNNHCCQDERTDCEISSACFPFHDGTCCRPPGGACRENCDCCRLGVCLDFGSGNRCCIDQFFGGCQHDGECCGDLVCQGVCCRGNGHPCTDLTGGCCAGLECLAGQCLPPSTFCRTDGQSCSADLLCCTGLQCTSGACRPV